jgi:high affinity sulfate transporter 1
MNKGIYKWIPGLEILLNYKAEWFSKDMVAGLSVAAIALPIGIAYSGLAGFPPEVGLYSTILPMAAFALFGSSKKLIVGPDSSACMMVATILLPFAALGSAAQYEACIVLSLLAGILCILGGVFRLGFLADFFSKPILTGYLNGLALTVILSQIGRVFGYKTKSTGFFRGLVDFLSRLGETHTATLILGLSVMVFLIICKKISRKIPAPLIASILASAAVYFLGLSSSGVVVLGPVPAGLPAMGIPGVNLSQINELLPGALSLVLISYCSGMLTEKSFAAKYGYEIDANKEFTGFGMANIASGFSGGFVVSGADSRTAVSASMDGKTPLTAIIASLALLAILLFFTAPLIYLPNAALGAIVIVAVFGLFDIAYVKKLYKINRREFFLSLVTTLGVMTIGVLEGVMIAVGLALVGLVARAAKPHDTLLGKVDNVDGYQSIEEYEDAKTIPGLIIYRFDAGLVFFNSDYFRNRVRTLINDSIHKPEMLLINCESINLIDSTANDMLEDLINELNAKGIKVAFARPKKVLMKMFEKSGVAVKIGKENFYSSVRTCVDAYLNKNKSEN